MQIKLMADGRTEARGTALVCHNERLADPLDSIAGALAELTGKRKKAKEDHLEIARREFFGGLYTNPAFDWVEGELMMNPGVGADPVPYEGFIGMPAWNILRCLQEGAKRHRRGQDILRGVSPITDFAPLIYEGPQDPESLWQDGGFALRKSVGVQRARTMRTRPIFREWRLELDMELDATVLDVATIRFMWRDAGKYAGLCDMRPVFGRFNATVEVVTIDPEEAELLDAIPITDAEPDTDDDEVEDPAPQRTRRRRTAAEGD